MQRGLRDLVCRYEMCGKGFRGTKHQKFCSLTCSNRSHRFDGDQASYLAHHKRLYRVRGKAKDHTCKCGARGRDWANLTGRFEDMNDYEAMCRSCHLKYDHRPGGPRSGKRVGAVDIREVAA